MVEKSKRLLVRYKDYDSYVRARLLMGPVEGKLKSLGGSLLMTLDEFHILQEVLQEGAKKVDKCLLEYEQLGEEDSFDPAPQKIVKAAPEEASP